jgi:hypothetical protein
VSTNQKGEFISEGTPLGGAIFRVREVIHRMKCATVQFPGESAWVTIYEELGQDIKKWIKREVGARCKVRVISREWVPCLEKVDRREVYDDAQFGITLLEPLPEVQPVDHTFTRHPNFRKKLEDKAWKALMQERRDLETKFFRDAKSGQDSDVAKYWDNIRWNCERIQRDWLMSELPKIRPEQVDPGKCAPQIWKEIETDIKAFAIQRSREDDEVHRVMEEQSFYIKAIGTYKLLYPILDIQDEIQKKANLWTQERDAFLTTSLQKMDSFIQMGNAETCWQLTCGNPILEFVDPEIIHRRALEIRMLCMDEVVLETVSVRCWNCVSKAEKISQAQREVGRHLAHYGPIKETIAARMSVAIIKALRSDLETERKGWIWRRLLAAMEILGCGISRLDERVYHAWWDSVINNREHADREVEEDGALTWLGIPIKEKQLMGWVAEKIIAMDPRKAPDALKRFRICLDPPKEMAERVARIILESAETTKGYVKLWAKLIRDNVMDSPWLLSELMRAEWDEKELRTELRRRA